MDIEIRELSVTDNGNNENTAQPAAIPGLACVGVGVACLGVGVVCVGGGIGCGILC